MDVAEGVQPMESPKRSLWGPVLEQCTSGQWAFVAAPRWGSARRAEAYAGSDGEGWHPVGKTHTEQWQRVIMEK